MISIDRYGKSDKYIIITLGALASLGICILSFDTRSSSSG